MLASHVQMLANDFDLWVSLAKYFGIFAVCVLIFAGGCGDFANKFILFAGNFLLFAK